MCFKLVHKAKLTEYTQHITLHSTVASVTLWSPNYVIGHRNVLSGHVFVQGVWAGEIIVFL